LFVFTWPNLRLVSGSGKKSFWIHNTILAYTYYSMPNADCRYTVDLCKSLGYVLRIHKILVWIQIRIRGSMPLTSGCGSGSESGNGSGSCYFRHKPSKRKQKTYFFKSLSAYYCLKVHLHNFSKIKSQKESQNSRNQGFSYYFCMMTRMTEGSGSGSGSIPLTHGSGSGSRKPKNMWIRWILIRIRIRNTEKKCYQLRNRIPNAKMRIQQLLIKYMQILIQNPG
jgi:hypothetical protein